MNSKWLDSFAHEKNCAVDHFGHGDKGLKLKLTGGQHYKEKIISGPQIERKRLRGPHFIE
jgi:hypothetical protein